MLSVCGSVYQDGYFLDFVRGILDRASNPDGIEFVVSEDEAGSQVMAEVFDQVRSMTRHLKVLPVPRQERVDYIRKCVSFYERERIFPPSSIGEFRARLDRYESGQLPRMWFAPAWNYNRAISAASGDVIVNTPMDLHIHFDLWAAYLKFARAAASRNHLLVHFGLRNTDEFRYHGLRMFDRGLFLALKKRDLRFTSERRPPGPPPSMEFSFDERWFVRALYDDDWNDRAILAGGGSLGWEELFGERLLFSMPDSSWQPEYLCNDMYRDWRFFADCIGKYMSRVDVRGNA